MYTNSQVLALLRAEIDDIDSPPSHPVVNENLARNVWAKTNKVDGSNKAFRLNNRRLVDDSPTSTSLHLLRDGVALVLTTDFTVDAIRGAITIVTAAPTDTLIASQYDFLLFLDAELQLHITKGLQFIGYTDVTTVPDGLVLALVHKSAATAFKALASRTANQFDAAAGGKSITKSSIKKQYLELAKEQEALATEERDMFYKRQGRRNAPAFGSFATQQQVYTPKR